MGRGSQLTDSVAHTESSINEQVDLTAGAHAVARNLRRPSLDPDHVAALAMLIDVAGIGLGLWFAAFVSFPFTFDPSKAAMYSAFGAAITIAALSRIRLYSLAELRRFIRGAAAVCASGSLLAILGGCSPASLACVMAVAVSARGLNALLTRVVLDFGLTKRRAVLIGGGERAAQVMTALNSNPDNDIQVHGIFDDRDDSRSPLVVNGVPKLGKTTALLAFARAAEIDMLIVTLPLSAEKRIQSLLKAVETLPIDVRLSDFSADPAFRRHGSAAAQGGLISVVSRPLHGR